MSETGVSRGERHCAERDVQLIKIFTAQRMRVFYMCAHALSLRICTCEHLPHLRLHLLGQTKHPQCQLLTQHTHTEDQAIVTIWHQILSCVLPNVVGFIVNSFLERLIIPNPLMLA